MRDGYAILRSGPDALPYAADWFEEAGAVEDSAAIRSGRCIPGAAEIAARASGYGFGYGYGFGFGFGYGYGYGFGFGFGTGYGYGSGYGSGFGSGFGFGWLTSYQWLSTGGTVGDCEIGANYLVMLPFGLAYVGRFVRPSGPFGGVFEAVANVHDTGGGANWADLARGDGRPAATFHAFDGPATFPSVLAAFRWAGDLPTPAAPWARRRAAR